MEKILKELSELPVDELRIAIDSMHPVDTEEMDNVLFYAKVISDKLKTIGTLPVILTIGTEEY